MPRVGIVGVGLIGRAWSNVFARAGWDVRLFDTDEQTREAAPELIHESLQDLARHGLVADADGAGERLAAAATLAEAVDGADLVQESGPEHVESKLEIFKELDAAAPPSAVLASSSSAIVASRFTKELAGRDRCLIAHPVNPPHIVPIVELCGAPWTSPAVIERAREIYNSVGQVPVEVKKETDGFLLNRMQAVLLTEALRLVSEGYCTATDLDKTIAYGLGLRWSFMGPFETIELNAPGGIADYCERYGPAFYEVAAAEVAQDIWSKATTDRVAADWGPTPTEDDVTRKSRWRDDRLAALMAHKRAQKSYE